MNPKNIRTLSIAVLCILSMAGCAKDIRSVRVINEYGTEVKSIQCMIKGSNGSVIWEKSKAKAGIVDIDINELRKSSVNDVSGLDMLLMADGYGPEFLRYDIGDIPAEIKLEKSVNIVIEKKGETLPGYPVIVALEYYKELIYSFGSYPLKLKQNGPNRWECELKKDQEYAIGWKVNKGKFANKFHAYGSEPFVAVKDGQIVSFEPRMPVTFKYDLSNVPEFLNIEKYPVIIELDKKGPSEERYQFSFYGEGTVEINRAGIAQIPNLAAGSYFLTAYTNPGRHDKPQISDRRVITIKPRDENYVAPVCPVYPVLDTTVDAGDVLIRGVILDAEHNPMANKEVSLWMQRFNEKGVMIASNVFYEPVKTNSKGKYEFKGVQSGQNIQLNCLGHTVPLTKESLTENAVVDVFFVIGQKGEVITIAKPFVLPMVRRVDGQKRNLNELKGKIIVIDIWASWCSPCIGSISKLNELAKEFKAEDIQFVAISIDGDRQAWTKKVAENSWQSILHVWFDNTINDHQLQRGEAIPFCIVIDSKGIVRAAGNEIDIKSEIEKIQKN